MESSTYGLTIKESKEIINTKFRAAVTPGERGMWSGKVLWFECLCASKIHMLNPNLQGDSIRRWGLWEGIRS